MPDETTETENAPAIPPKLAAHIRHAIEKAKAAGQPRAQVKAAGIDPGDYKVAARVINAAPDDDEPSEWDGFRASGNSDPSGPYLIVEWG
jgi:hypothetical protein